MKLRTRYAGQFPFVPQTCRDAEVAITAVFSRSKSMLIGGAATASSAMQFSLGGSRV